MDTGSDAGGNDGSGQGWKIAGVAVQLSLACSARDGVRAEDTTKLNYF